MSTALPFPVMQSVLSPQHASSSSSATATRQGAPTTTRFLDPRLDPSLCLAPIDSINVWNAEHRDQTWGPNPIEVLEPAPQFSSYTSATDAPVPAMWRNSPTTNHILPPFEFFPSTPGYPLHMQGAAVSEYFSVPVPRNPHARLPIPVPQAPPATLSLASHQITPSPPHPLNATLAEESDDGEMECDEENDESESLDSSSAESSSPSSDSDVDSNTSDVGLEVLYTQDFSSDVPAPSRTETQQPPPVLSAAPNSNQYPVQIQIPPAPAVDLDQSLIDAEEYAHWKERDDVPAPCYVLRTAFGPDQTIWTRRPNPLSPPITVLNSMQSHRPVTPAWTVNPNVLYAPRPLTLDQRRSPSFIQEAEHDSQAASSRHVLAEWSEKQPEPQGEPSSQHPMQLRVRRGGRGGQNTDARGRYATTTPASRAPPSKRDVKGKGKAVDEEKARRGYCSWVSPSYLAELGFRSMEEAEEAGALPDSMCAHPNRNPGSRPLASIPIPARGRLSEANLSTLGKLATEDDALAMHLAEQMVNAEDYDENGDLIDEADEFPCMPKCFAAYGWTKLRWMKYCDPVMTWRKLVVPGLDFDDATPPLE